MSIKRKRKFRHLTQKDRDLIDVLARDGYTLQRIAEAKLFSFRASRYREINLA